MTSENTSIQFESFGNIVNGQQRFSAEKHNGVDPTTKEALWDVPIASSQDIEDATDVAQMAFRTWSRVPFEERQSKIQEYRNLMATHAPDLTKCLIKETGKPKGIAELEIHSTLETMDWYIGIQRPVLPRFEDAEKEIENIYEPLGTVVAITPWNFPLLLPIAKATPALLMGNVVIMKPSPFTPYTVLKAAEIAQQVFGPGVVQALNGADNLGPVLVNHPNIHKITFTGSTATGRRIMADAAKTMKRVTLELGGNDPCIVLPDVDIQKTAFNVALGAFFNSGQVCVATKRALIHASIYQPFLEALSHVAETFKLGKPYEEGVMIGPIQNQMQFDKLKAIIQNSKSSGHKFVAGSDTVVDGKGLFIHPTVLDNPPTDSYIFSEEQFGPILPCQPWSDEEDVVRRANDTVAGLGATIFGKNPIQTQRIASQLQCGQVWINSFPKPAPQAHFGGHKQSGIGTENGTAGLLAYANIKSIYRYKPVEGAKL